MPRPPKLTKTGQLIAIEMYLQWPTETEEQIRKVLEHILWVVREGSPKPEEKK